MAYLDIEIEKGKWYISEGYICINAYTATPDEREKMIKHNQGIDRMILAGPFDSVDAAKAHEADFTDKISPLIWTPY